MNEGRTTAIFAAVAAISFGLAWWSRPGVITDENDILKDKVGQAIFTNFQNADAASSFEIVKYDEELAQLERFSVVKDTTSSMWKLPSFDDYPADATEQVRDATTPLVDLIILDVASPDRGDHSLYGVVNPDDEELTVSEQGVGMLVAVKDVEDKVLASLIIGKEVEKAENQRYVRVPTEDAVFVVEFDTTPFTTDFQTWIDSKLLDISSFDITAIGLRDYAVLPMQGGGYGMSRNYDAELSFDPSLSKWSLNSLTLFDGGKATESGLAPGERLQDTALNDLRNAAQDLTIVGVRRKPEGLADDLKADKSLVENQESLNSLYEQGFFPQETPAGIEIFATGGETSLGTSDGVKYLLRFGESDAALGSDEAENAEAGLRRYLLVTAKLDDDQFPQPDLEVQPETVEEMLQMRAEASGDAAPATPEGNQASENGPADQEPTPSPETTATPDPESGESAPVDPEAPPIPPAEEGTDQTAKPSPEPAAESEAETPALEEPASEETPAAEPSDVDLDDCGPQDESQEDSQTASDPQEAADDSATTTPAEEEAAAASAGQTAEELAEELAAVRDQINRENQRKIDERNEKISAARKKVQELNARFAGWYYIVSDSVYKKLTLSKDQLITTAAAPAGANPMPGAGFPGGIPGLGGQPPAPPFGGGN